MAIYVYYIYFLVIHITILVYYILTLISNQSKHRIISLKKTDGIRVIERIKREFNIDFEATIINSKISDIQSYKLFNNKLVINSKYANISYLDNISLIATSYLAGLNSWIKNEIFIKNYLIVSYYLIIVFVLLFILTQSLILGMLSIITLIIFTTVVLIDLILRTLHINLTVEFLSKLDLIDKDIEEIYVQQILNLWKVKSLDVYYRLISDIADFLRRKKKETSP